MKSYLEPDNNPLLTYLVPIETLTHARSSWFVCIMLIYRTRTNLEKQFLASGKSKHRRPTLYRYIYIYIYIYKI
jgi:hypothetical protein